MFWRARWVRVLRCIRKLVGNLSFRTIAVLAVGSGQRPVVRDGPSAVIEALGKRLGARPAWCTALAGMMTSYWSSVGVRRSKADTDAEICGHFRSKDSLGQCKSGAHKAWFTMPDSWFVASGELKSGDSTSNSCM